ncbi:hypothetical protein AKJ16_DCAP08654 [Drosera capensis]
MSNSANTDTNSINFANRVVDDSAIDASNELFLHHSDHPNCSLSHKLLDEDNYNHWQRSVEVSLVAKNKLGKAIAEMMQNQCLIQFLIGLDDSYKNVKGTILMMQPLPSVSQAYQMVIEVEKQRDKFFHWNKNSTAGANKGSNGSNDSQPYVGSHEKKSQMFCTYCKTHGHTIDQDPNIRAGDQNLSPGANSSISQEQYGHLMALLSKLGGSSLNAAAHTSMMAGSFNEETTGPWQADRRLIHYRTKLMPRATPCTFVGYSYQRKAYKLLDLVSQQIFESRDVLSSRMMACSSVSTPSDSVYRNSFLG